ncbi:MAG: hypothetical protein V3R68_04290 [Gammaproteobacteria bacterium]
MHWQFSKPFILVLNITAIPVLLYSATADDIPAKCPAEIETVNKRQNNSERRVVEDKLKLLNTIVHGSSTALRIEKSENRKAIELLEDARESLEYSNKLFALGCIKASEGKLNNGIQAIETASRLVIDNRRLDKIVRQRYVYLNDQIAGFRDAYDRIAREKDSTAVDILDTSHLDELLRSADKLAQNDNYKAANKVMLSAANMIASALIVIRDKETLKHELKFESIEEEYAYAMETNRNYTKLLDMVLENRSFSRPVRISIERLVTRNKELRNKADTNLSKGNKEAALANLEEGTGNLIRALRFTDIGL